MYPLLDNPMLRAFCTLMRDDGFLGLGIFRKGWTPFQIETEVIQAQEDNAPVDAVYRVKTMTARSNGYENKWVWRTFEDLYEKADAKDKEFLAQVMTQANNLSNKKKAA